MHWVSLYFFCEISLLLCPREMQNFSHWKASWREKFLLVYQIHIQCAAFLYMEICYQQYFYFRALCNVESLFMQSNELKTWQFTFIFT